ncbi:hypothetical protein ACN47E_000571 [Coniothyrium glycines]
MNTASESPDPSIVDHEPIQQDIAQNQPRQYDIMTVRDLRTEMTSRDISLHGCNMKEHYISALMMHDKKKSMGEPCWQSKRHQPASEREGNMWRQKLDNKQGWEIVVEIRHKSKIKEQKYTEVAHPVRTCSQHMLESSYKADPSRLTFLDLPPEIRNIIYEYSWSFDLNDSISRGYFWIGPDGQLHRIRSRAPRKKPQLDLGEYYREDFLEIVHVLGAINKQIRLESRSLFWSKTSLRVEEEIGYFEHQAFIIVIDRLGSVAAAFLKSLEYARHKSFRVHDYGGKKLPRDLVLRLEMCRNLQHINLGLTIPEVFGNDELALRAHFFGGQPLDSRGLYSLMRNIIALPRLTTFLLKVVSDSTDINPRLAGVFDSDFLHYAFSGSRRDALLEELYKTLQANNIAKYHKLREGGKVRLLAGRIAVFMTAPKSEYVNFDTWLQWYNAD